LNANAIGDDPMQPAGAVRAAGTRVSVDGLLIGVTLPLDTGSIVREGVCVVTAFRMHPQP